MQLAIKQLGSKKAGTIEVSEAAFAREYNESLVHQVVVALMAAGRAGTKAQKTRSERSGGGIKPWRQKGTGRARAGTIRSPIWRKGGITFAAKPRDFSQKVNRKMMRNAIRAVLSELIRQERLVVVKELALEQPKTKALVAKLAEMGMKDVLIVTSEIDTNLYLAARNLSKVNVIAANEIDPLKLIRYSTVLVTEKALRDIEEVYSNA